MKTRRRELWWVLVCLAFTLSLHAQSELRDKSQGNSGFVTANGVRLHYLDWGGAGETMLFLHGIGDTAHTFDGFAPKFTNQFHVIGLTRRGHGESDVPDRGYDTATRVEDIRQFLDALKIPRVVLVGFSASGGEVTMFAGKHPERTIKAVYLDALIDAHGQPTLYRRAPPELRRAQDAALDRKRSRALQLMAAGETHTDYAKIKAPVLAIAVVGFPTNAFDAFKNLPEPRRKVAEEALREVLVVKKRETERFRKELPNARFVMLTNANHACFVDREDDVVREMRAFLADSEWTDTSPHKSQFIKVNGVRLHYLDWGGKGDTLLFLHGLGDTAHIYDLLAPKFTNDFRVLGLTRRGHGQSDKPETGYDTATLVEDIRQFLDALTIRHVVLVGHSIAGDELTCFAGAHPDRVAKLVYLDAAYDRAGLPEIFKERPPELSPTKTDMESLGSFRRWVSRMSFWSDAWEANLREMMVFSADGKILQEVKPGKVSRLLMQGTVDSHPDYTKIKSPALNIAVIGFSSRLSDFVQTLPESTRAKAQGFLGKAKEFQEQQGERFRKELPGARVVVLTNADHHCFIDREADVVREMRAFLVNPGSTDTSPHKSEFINVNGVRLHYLDWGGKGETLLFLHGMGGSAHTFDDFAPSFTNQFRVLALTRRGHGESEMPESGYDALTLVEDVRQFLDALKIQRVALAGHSFAGDELTRFAATYPDRVIKLIYFDSAYDHSRVPPNLRWKPVHGVMPEILPTSEESESANGGRRWVNRVWGKKMAPIIYTMIVGTYAEPHDYRKIKAPTLAFFATGYCSSPAADSKCPGFDRNKILAWVESLPEPRRIDAQDLIEAQRKYYKQEIEHFRREIPNGRAIVYTNADHVCFFDREPDVLREMRSFLEK